MFELPNDVCSKFRLHRSMPVINLDIKQTRETTIILKGHRCSRENLNLKGNCHATWQVLKKPEGVFGSIEFQN